MERFLRCRTLHEMLPCAESEGGQGNICGVLAYAKNMSRRIQKRLGSLAACEKGDLGTEVGDLSL